MVQVLADFDALRPKFQAKANAGGGELLSSVRLDCPIMWPNKIIALPANYRGHIDEMKARGGGITTLAANLQGFF